jgi:hypothetical protein
LATGTNQQPNTGETFKQINHYALRPRPAALSSRTESRSNFKFNDICSSTCTSSKATCTERVYGKDKDETSLAAGGIIEGREPSIKYVDGWVKRVIENGDDMTFAGTSSVLETNTSSRNNQYIPPRSFHDELHQIAQKRVCQWVNDSPDTEGLEDGHRYMFRSSHPYPLSHDHEPMDISTDTGDLSTEQQGFLRGSSRQHRNADKKNSHSSNIFQNMYRRLRNGLRRKLQTKH